MSSRLKLAGICVAAAFALAACGGGGGSPLDSARAERDRLAAALAQAQADRAAALAAQQAAEAAQTAAEAERDAAIAAQQMAETERDAAQAARDAAQMAQQTAEDARDAAQAAQQMAEDARNAAQMARDAALAAQGTAETDRDAAQMARDAAQAERDRLANDLTATQAERDAAQLRLDAANQELMDRQTALDEANAALETKTEELNAKIAELATKTTELATKTAELEAKQRELAGVQRQLEAAQKQLADAQKAREDAEAEAARAAAIATARKLHTGISAPIGDANSPAPTDRAAAYNDAGTPTGSTADTHILVSIGDGTNTPTAVALSEDKDTTVAALHGWTGKRYHRTTPASDGTYEAYVYSHVGEPTQGDKFGQTGVTTPADGYEYGLNAQGMLTTLDTATRIASPSFDHTAGVKEFELGTNREYVSISGTYHGVPGEYRCTPATDSTCAVQVAGARGFNLGGTADTGNAFTAGGGDWTFKPSNPEARVMSTPDSSYASYGWWLHTAANGDLTASAFVDRRGAADEASGLNDLNGTATYVGGAAGKYALSSSTGGTNDAGHFTARVTLEADFTVNTASDTTTNGITGTIDQFVGADGESRDWSVKLNGSPIGDTGAIGDTTEGTEWTIGGNAADDSGQWSGSLQENGDDGVPAIATGTFYSTYGTSGRMVGAFGANKQ